MALSPKETPDPKALAPGLAFNSNYLTTMSSLNHIHCVCTDSGTILPSEVVKALDTRLLTDEEMEEYNGGGDSDVIDIAVEKGVSLSDFIKYSNSIKLNYIHSTLQEMQNGNKDDHMIERSLEYVEEIRDAFDRLYPKNPSTYTLDS